MRKIIIGASIIALSLAGANFVSANNGMATVEKVQGEYGVFTQFVKKDLTEVQKNELKTLLEKQKAGMKMIKATVGKVKSGELNNYEEFAKIAPKRKAMGKMLEAYMEDKAGFKYFCMNHGDNLIAKLFADEKIVSKYKSILEKKYKSQISELYSKKGKALEKIIHKAYHKQINNKNVKSLSIIRAIELIVEDIKEKNKVSTMNEFGDFTQFAKKDLSEIERKALLELIGERKAAQGKFKKMLDQAKKDGNFDAVFKIVQNKRAGCQARFALYLDETKKDAFNAHCKKMGEKLEAMYK